MNQQILNEPSRWQQRLRAMGPGIMMASAAVGGSHIIASTQAGALYGWQLALIIVLANLFKYPFFRFGPQYTLETGKSLLEGYAEKSRVPMPNRQSDTRYGRPRYRANRTGCLPGTIWPDCP